MTHAIANTSVAKNQSRRNANAKSQRPGKSAKKSFDPMLAWKTRELKMNISVLEGFLKNTRFASVYPDTTKQAMTLRLNAFRTELAKRDARDAKLKAAALSQAQSASVTVH